MKTKKNIKKMSFSELCEAVEKGNTRILEGFEGLDELDNTEDTEAEGDADFTDDFADDDTPVVDDTEGETEAAGKVTVEIDPNAPLSEVLRVVADAIEAKGADDVVLDDTEDEGEVEDEVEDDETSDDELVEDDTEKNEAEEDEELAAADTNVKTASTKELSRVKKTPAINRNKVVDADLGTIVKQEGDPAGVKPLSRVKKTPAIDRSKTAKSRIAPHKRLTDIGKGGK